MEIRERVLGPDHPACAETLNNFGELYLQWGERTKTNIYFQRAEPLLQRALKIREKVLGAEHPDVVETLKNLAQLYEKRGDKAKAQVLLQRSARISDKLGLEKPGQSSKRQELPRGRKPQRREAKNAI